ncbi:hypothetical protein K469DRAFT_683719 [Zopfia rhizophila CBS 207.26]|uniref:Uncharacterized protein n=1 Tax=Zopfia rhizophila CBS 207.26 TaxID=1314779 RepID=A0A6A6EF88_9PEZI|nr:hypothetical protein K469DRAFT_683719 [Zopfia rhizophila CBS 207.26]
MHHEVARIPLALETMRDMSTVYMPDTTTISQTPHARTVKSRQKTSTAARQHHYTTYNARSQNDQHRRAHECHTDPEVVVAWMSDQHILLHACFDPDGCRLPLEYLISPSRRRHPDVLDDVSPAAKRRRVPLADVDPNSRRKQDIRRAAEFHRRTFVEYGSVYWGSGFLS